MRSITKQGSGGFHLRQAHANPPLATEQATSRWDNYRYKHEALSCLLDEQFHLCCYSELRADQEGLGYHIEHVEPKSLNPQRTFDYSNLAACALVDDDLQTFKTLSHETFGGHAKLNMFDANRFISCHQGDCSRFFAYLSDGRIIPHHKLNSHEQEQAQYTIDTLNLNSPYLVTKRRQWWDELDQLYQEHVDKDWSLRDLAAIDLIPSSYKMSRFFSLTRQFFGSIAENVLREQAPKLL